MAYLSEEERANLVAYLDGELDEAQARVLEARLSNDPRARAEAESLRRTWDLLDYLPRTEASTSFTHRTLEKLAVQTGVRPIARRRRWPWWLRAAAWAAAVLLAAGVGFGVANLLWPRQQASVQAPAEVEARMARDLRVIRHKRLYEHVDDLQFLRELDDPDLFGDDETAW
jgi:anti-sigma factor RsiW